MKKVMYLVFVFVLFSFLFAFLVEAAPPTNLRFENNYSATLDEGTFHINWTAATGLLRNYSVFISTDGGTSFISHFFNNSNTGLSYTAPAQGNYTFKVGTNTWEGPQHNQSVMISIFVDKTPPTTTLPLYTNSTLMQPSSTLPVNIYVTDPYAGATGSCLVNVNGTNNTLSLSNAWCNNSGLSLSGLGDGRYPITIWSSDTFGNAGIDNTLYFMIDTTNPSVTSTCSPTTVSPGDAFPCSCSGTDATSGVNSSVGSSTSGSTTSTTTEGNFAYTCIVTDNAGNSANSTINYTVTTNPTNTTDQDGNDNEENTTNTSDENTSEQDIIEEFFNNGTTDEEGSSGFFWLMTLGIIILMGSVFFVLMKLIKKKIDTEENLSNQSQQTTNP